METKKGKKKEKNSLAMAEGVKKAGFLFEYQEKLFYIGPIVGDSVPYNKEMVQAFLKHKCGVTYKKHQKEIQKYKEMLSKEDKDEAAIVVVGINDFFGQAIAHQLFTEKQLDDAENKFKPTLGTIASKEWLIKILSVIDNEMSIKLGKMDELPVVVINFGVVNVYNA